jgi:serine/threonine protein kinase
MSDAVPMAVFRDALPLRTVIHGYTIRAVLGRGGFGTTYHATDQLDQPFAIKEYFPRRFAVRRGLEVVAGSRELGLNPPVKTISRVQPPAPVFTQTQAPTRPVTERVQTPPPTTPVKTLASSTAIKAAVSPQPQVRAKVVPVEHREDKDKKGKHDK